MLFGQTLLQNGALMRGHSQELCRSLRGAVDMLNATKLKHVLHACKSVPTGTADVIVNGTIVCVKRDVGDEMLLMT